MSANNIDKIVQQLIEHTLDKTKTILTQSTLKDIFEKVKIIKKDKVNEKSEAEKKAAEAEAEAEAEEEEPVEEEAEEEAEPNIQITNIITKFAKQYALEIINMPVLMTKKQPIVEPEPESEAEPAPVPPAITADEVEIPNPHTIKYKEQSATAHADSNGNPIYINASTKKQYPTTIGWMKSVNNAAKGGSKKKRTVTIKSDAMPKTVKGLETRKKLLKEKIKDAEKKVKLNKNRVIKLK